MTGGEFPSPVDLPNLYSLCLAYSAKKAETFRCARLIIWTPVLCERARQSVHTFCSTTRCAPATGSARSAH